MASPQPLCAIADCDVARTGKCHIGHDPVEQCPNYAPEAAGSVEEEESVAATPAPSVAPPVGIASGDVMLLSDLAAFMRSKSVRSVALVGEQKAGKTTLLASLYAMYCKGPFANMRFVGSRTLVGFAKRHQLALLNSERAHPTTPRTSRDEPVAFFHLALAHDHTARPVDLIISDRSGEAYAAARLDTSLIQQLPELRYAERVCFLLDGAKLIARDKRAPYSRQFKQMIHALHDNGALSNATAIEVLATKFDITNKGDVEEQVNYLTSYESAMVKEFSVRGLNVTCHRVCALPKADRGTGFLGLAETIERWTAPLAKPDLSIRPLHNSPRQFDRMLAKSTVEGA